MRPLTDRQAIMQRKREIIALGHSALTLYALQKLTAKPHRSYDRAYRTESIGIRHETG